MPYVDGFVIPVPRSKVDAYKALATRCGEVWREFGALEFRECMADDVQPGKVTSFPQSVDLRDDEVVFFSWITFASRADRDAINERVMKDPRLSDMMDATSLPFDASRLVYGGFEVAVSL